ncbi:MAG: hypothetical protein KIT57_20570 [Blastocatellales bacterium]|nr:hypothetical protein [Blastocatellales bacterium]
MNYIRRTAAAVLFFFLLVGTPSARVQRPEDIAKRKSFGALVDRLSEKAGYFGSDNLVSNELSMLHVLGKLSQMNVTGGAYIGVGPDQNFSYIAQIKPRIAIMVDIRRDALLQHLLFKSIFMMSRNRVEYLSLLFGRPLPRDFRKWNNKTITELVDYVDRTAADEKLVARTHTEIHKRLSGFGVELSERDLETIDEIYRAFHQSGLEVRYTIRDRPTGRFFPAYRELLLEKDLDGRQRNYLAAESDFQVIKTMQDRDLIIPATGDLSGLKAVKAIGDYLHEINEKVSAFYVSNVEFYLVRNGSFDRFVENLRALPINERSVIIRSYFNYAYYTSQHPQTIDNYFSVQLLQTIESLLRDQSAGGYDSYYDLVTRRSLDLRATTP